ncbi:hypothetical protein B1A99_10470 [Cohnella sp. CIP 111063]|uniref:DUF523 domain-containing protein n=1 Tax=unclassified Cohnella TaxID=2636738 RepID=UPI000B8C68C6|nr:MULTISPECIES: DUF523 domain-containing protein [unclassified Cohnella]OXS59944.1 hypothetical protein B1A99_10470 [Cohnella sp. CIP 111063]PRX72754.1 uncharacterized protein YbbK (DUF523 family) [Cohnella sp. SGD-V74]
MAKKILVSACLLGHKVRYDNGDVPCLGPRFLSWYEEGRLVSICPEVVGGLPTPRPDAQRQGDRVVTGAGADVTEPFRKGAEAALKLALEHEAELAILKQDSPSCGSLFIYDGTFTDTIVPGEGTTTELLRRNGIKVYGEDQLDEVERELAQADR